MSEEDLLSDQRARDKLCCDSSPVLPVSRLSLSFSLVSESHRMLTRHTRGAGSEPIEHISLDRIPGMGRASASSKIGAGARD